MIVLEVTCCYYKKCFSVCVKVGLDSRCYINCVKVKSPCTNTPFIVQLYRRWTSQHHCVQFNLGQHEGKKVSHLDPDSLLNLC